MSTEGRRVPPNVPLFPENQGQLMAAEEGKHFSLGRGKPMAGRPITYSGWPHTHKQLQKLCNFLKTGSCGGGWEVLGGVGDGYD